MVIFSTLKIIVTVVFLIQSAGVRSHKKKIKHCCCLNVWGQHHSFLIPLTFHLYIYSSSHLFILFHCLGPSLFSHGSLLLQQNQIFHLCGQGHQLLADSFGFFLRVLPLITFPLILLLPLVLAHQLFHHQALVA